jgi:GntR family transcriptional regulator
VLMKQMKHLFGQNKVLLYRNCDSDLYASSMSVAPPVRELDITLERNSPVPLYYQLAQAIEHAINTGALAPGDRLENELSLTSRLGLSRPTARQAIQELVKKGLLVRKRGVGTQVVRSQFRRTEALSSLNEDIIKAGKVPSTRLLEFSVGSLDEQDVRDAIEAAAVPETEFIKIRRLRLADEMPLAVLTNYLPARFELTEEDLRTKSLYACLRSLGVNLKIAHQQISARLMNEEEAELLDVETPAACLTVDRVAYDDIGQFVEFGRHMYHAAHYSIQSSLVA